MNNEPILNIESPDLSKEYSIFVIADWFLKQTLCDHKKLQKLCYYAQAWSLTLRNRRITTGNFEAWVHGPVNYDLWKECSDFGYMDIPTDFLSKYHENIFEDDDAFLHRVLSTYGKFSGYDLECLTHTEKPWQIAREIWEEQSAVIP